MGSHSVTFHPAAVTSPPLPQPRLVLDLATTEGCKAELTGRTVLYQIKSLDDTKPNTNPKTKTKTNPNRNTNLNPKLTQILTLFSCFMLFFEYRPLIFSLAITK